ncbi:hypothetical protein BCU70_21845 [Vibrio sp. 10N.286.49.C2]|uniref:hypothetical protein n=1 Tax=Vibrio sp. 10N.286.48.B7 TaxID=1880853 RepID=UPI000C82E8FF|nr:hypothetical protein BCU70_21845 [Vibrio sp. 10N.286.49.C2]PMH50836.1 hypothetical protein BCU66_17905 [Vibrio sp. 10N.286.49.B1]PMH79548.1 hypothetical protein BCU58_04780 [Vibrio sp. 10N.286.48.B7]
MHKPTSRLLSADVDGENHVEKINIVRLFLSQRSQKAANTLPNSTLIPEENTTGLDKKVTVLRCSQ